MPQTPDWRQALETGMQFTQLRRDQARRVAADLVAQGQLARDQMAGAVDEIIEMSRRRSDALSALVRTEVQKQLGAIGIATKADVARLERKLEKATKAAKKAAPAKKAAKKPAKAAAKKAG